MPYKTATNNSAYHRIQVGNLVFMTNLFNASAGGIADVNTVSARFDIPLRDCPEIGVNEEFQSFDACHSGCAIDGDITISYTGVIGDTSGGVRGFPAMILGSAGGRRETWGVPCNSITILHHTENDSGVGVQGWRDFVANPDDPSNPDDQRSHVYDLRDAQRATGYPALAAELPDTTVTIAAQDCGAASTVNGFIDTYWHDVSAEGNTPTDKNGGKFQNLINTINGINGRCSRIWNLNLWWDHPDPSSEMTTRRFTGGRILQILPGNSRRAGNQNKVIIDGREQYIAIKWENGGNNNFFYVAFVFTPSNKKPVIDYNAYANYLTSDSFWKDILSDDYAQAIISAMRKPAAPPAILNTTGNRAKPVNVRRPDGAFAVDSIQVGTEMWGTTAEGTTGATCFSTLSIDTTPRRQRRLICETVSCEAIVS